MTLIAVSGNLMAADSWTWADDIGYPAKEPKICRAPDGSLVAGCGYTADCYALREWTLAGMDFKNPPAVRDEDSDQELIWLWLRPGGRVYHLSSKFVPVEMAGPIAIGWSSAASMVIGALLHNVPIVSAMRTAILRCPYVGGEVQVERVE